MTTNELNSEQVERMKPLLELVENIPERERMGICWAFLLTFRPEEYAKTVPWEKLNGEEWHYLLKFRPAFAGKCSWEKLNNRDWEQLLPEACRRRADLLYAAGE